MLIFLSRDGRLNAFAMQKSAIEGKAIAFIAHNSLGVQARPSYGSLNGSLLNQLLSLRDLMLLARSKRKSDRFALPFGT